MAFKALSIDTDIILHFQTIGKIGHPKINGNLDFLRFHKISDGVERHKNKFADKEEMLKIAEMLVNTKYNEGDERYFVYIDWKNEKIKGRFDSVTFKNAINEYISENYNAIIRPILNKRDLNTGNTMFTHQTAIEFLSNKLFKQYYGN